TADLFRIDDDGSGDTSPFLIDQYGNVSVGSLLNLGSSSTDPSGQNGSIYYNTTDNVFRGYSSSTWSDLGGADSDWTISGNDMYSAVSGNIGIGTSTPATLFTVATSTNIFNVTSGGNVGIGTVSPSAKLDVNGDISITKDGTQLITTYVNRGEDYYGGWSVGINLDTCNGNSFSFFTCSADQSMNCKDAARNFSDCPDHSICRRSVICKKAVSFLEP
ncbi:MAG: hypothetical protein V3T98_00015, partial [Candidatus Paceibacterota bacterium]